MQFFLFGSLMDDEVASLVLGRPVESGQMRSARLRGYRRLTVQDESYPALARDAASRVDGRLLSDVSDAELARMQFFESVEFAPAPCRVELDDGQSAEAMVFVATTVLAFSDQPWDFNHWLAHDKAQYLQQTRDWMNEYGRRSSLQLEAEWTAARNRLVR